MFDEVANEYRRLGYDVAHHGRDRGDGVAILGRMGLSGGEVGFPGLNRPPFDGARLLSATCGGVRVHTVDAPNGRALHDPHHVSKLTWLERLRTMVDARAPSILAGDVNVPADADVYDPVRWRRPTHASPPERAAIDAVLDVGLVDVTRQHLPEPGMYTSWSYRPGQFERHRGLRIDLALCTSAVAYPVVDVRVDCEERVTRHRRRNPPTTRRS